MRIPIVCFQCMKEDKDAAKPANFYEFRDDGRYEFICPKGHKSLTVLQQQKFELLFDIGAYAIQDGYYREAVSSFASSLERFYEFYSNVICFGKGIQKEALHRAWKIISNQSERQLGAFVFLYLIESGKKPEVLSNDNVKFRNEVIHKGIIPDRSQAIDFGQTVLDLIRPLLGELKSKYSKGIHQVIASHQRKCRELAVENTQVSYGGIRTIISLSVEDPGYSEKSLDELLVEKNKWWES